jgi:dynein light intermediate chain 1, cytosolic
VTSSLLPASSDSFGLLLSGEPGTGKRTLLTSLAEGSHSSFQFTTNSVTGNSQDNPRAALQSQDGANIAALSSPNPGAAAGEQGSGSGRQELLGLTYGYWDVADEESEGDGEYSRLHHFHLCCVLTAATSVLARVGAYTLRSSDPAYSHLLTYAFPATASETAESSSAAARKMLSSSVNGGLSSSSSGRGLNSSSGAGTSATAIAAANAQALQSKPSLAALADSLMLITLDWTQPQRFLDQLRRWLVIIRGVMDLASDGGVSRGKGSGGGWSSRWAVLDEMREACECDLGAVPCMRAPDNSLLCCSGIHFPIISRAIECHIEIISYNDSNISCSR